MKLILVILMVILSILVLPSLLLGLLLILWGSTHPLLAPVFIILMILIYLYGYTMMFRWVRNKAPLRKRAHLCYGGGILLCCIILAGFYISDTYQDRYARVEGEVDLYEYEPFKDNKLATLDKAATLQIKKPVPRLDGATALYPLYAAITQNLYPKEDYSVYLSDVSCNTTPTAYEMLLKKEKDIIFVAGPSENQKVMFQEAGEEMELTPIGKESFVFFVNVNNPVNDVTLEQIKDIYAGKITNWKQLGGEDEEIRAFQRPEESGSQTTLLKLMGDTPLMKPIKEDVAAGMGGIISQTASYQNRNNAIGYSFRFFTEEMVKNKEIKLLKINGVEPTIQNIQTDRYPITSPFYAIKLKSNQDAQSEQVLSWLTSAQGKELIEKSGYVPY